METNAMEQRLSFVLDYESGQWSMSELCERYGITRPTGYKWLGRFEAEGKAGLVERSRAPNGCPHETPERVVRLLLEARQRYGWGAKKLLQVLTKRHARLAWPARSTVNAILDRHGKLRKNRRRKKWAHPGAAALRTERPNQVWPADFKGQFKTKDGRYCYPLTVSDHYSRRLLLCKGLPSVKTQGARPAFRRLFQEVGLPEAMRTDNGVPFASTGIHGLCELSVWWMQLGIVHQRILPASPQENGAHERMHRELKRETARLLQTVRRQGETLRQVSTPVGGGRPPIKLGERNPTERQPAGDEESPEVISLDSHMSDDVDGLLDEIKSELDKLDS